MKPTDIIWYSWGSILTLPRPSQQPWHHGHREGSGAAVEKVAAVLDRLRCRWTQAREEVGPEEGAVGDVIFARAVSSGLERDDDDERTAIFAVASFRRPQLHRQTKPLTTPREPVG